MEAESMKAFLDTHVAFMLWNGDQFSPRATALMERSAMFISPVVRLELAFLREIDRIRATDEEVLGGLASEHGVIQSNDPLEAVISQAMDLDWTRDPFDRLLVATAKLHRCPLVSRDEVIREHFHNTVW